MFQKSSYKNRLITQGSKSIKLLYSIINLNTISFLPWCATINKPLGFLIGHSLNSQILSDLWEEICVKWIGQRDLVRNWQFFFAIHDNLGALEAATKTRQEDLDGRSFVRSLVYCTGFCIRTIPVHARDSREKIHCVVRRILLLLFLLLRTHLNPSCDIFFLQRTAVHFA